MPDETAPQPALPHLGPPPGAITAADSLSIAGRKAMWPHVDRLLRHELGVRDPDKPDELRRYRVATRRLRAALRLFEDAFRAADVDPLVTGLSDVADAVGLVRDLDVRIAGLAAWAGERGKESTAKVSRLDAAWRAERAHAATAMERRLESRRHARWLARLVEFVERPEPVSRGTRMGELVRDRAGSQLWRAYERVREFAPAIRWADAPTLHRLRIQAKRLRYSLEFLGDVLGPDRPWLVERLVALQDHLGALNDAVGTAAAVRAFLEAHHLELSSDERLEIATYLEDRERAARALRRGAGKPWRAIAGVTFARRLARTAIVR